ncbi:MAG: xanthine dehydrogenase family protein subunit M [Verrucomicrobiota bacterium]
MKPFTFSVADTPEGAVKELKSFSGARLIAGGTNLLDLMKETIMTPSRLVDINHLELAGLQQLPDGSVLLGALMTNADTAYHEVIQTRYPLLSQAILAGASPQLRNMATNGGNLMQRTRCYYFYDAGMPCNKRCPGTGCPAIPGLNRIHAILGTSDHCIAVHPSDFCVALAALAAQIHIQGPNGKRTLSMADFHRLPEDHPERDNNLADDEIITGIQLPPEDFAVHHAYLKIRDRQSYAFALVSVAAALRLEAGVISQARIALGGVAAKPWRVPEAEILLVGHPPSEDIFMKAAEHLLQGAVGRGHNDFKIPLAKRAIVRALQEAADM